jgi:hypothetical protein
MVMERINSLKKLKRSLSDKFKKPLEAPEANRKSMYVIDPDALQRQGFCHRCTAVQHKFECKHKFGFTENRCREHQHFPHWEVERNYHPQVVEVQGQCPNCLKRAAAEADLDFFLRIRNFKNKAFELDVYRDEKLTAAIRPQSRGDEYWVKRNKKEAAMVEKKRIRALSKKEAEAELSAIKATIDRFNPPTIVPHQISAPLGN